jgi:Secretion system C-terminal sorting domain/PKD domain
LHTYWIVNNASGAPPLQYNWNWGDGSPNDTLPYPSHTYASAGFYTICLTITDSVGCISAHCDSFNLARMNTANTMVYVHVVSSIPTSIEENQLLNISLFPNPTTSELTIENAELKIEKVALYNTVGEDVLNYQLSITNYQFSFHVSQLPAGIYFITVTDRVGNKVTKKVVKM